MLASSSPAVPAAAQLPVRTWVRRKGLPPAYIFIRGCQREMQNQTVKAHRCAWAIAAPLGPQAGLDSLGAVELRNTIASALGGLDLASTLVFDCPTAAAITAHILLHHQPTEGAFPPLWFPLFRHNWHLRHSASPSACPGAQSALPAMTPSP